MIKKNELSGLSMGGGQVSQEAERSGAPVLRGCDNMHAHASIGASSAERLFVLSGPFLIVDDPVERTCPPHASLLPIKTREINSDTVGFTDG